MRHRKHSFKVGRTSSHRRAMLANMACSLFVEGRIETTVAKAKELRRVAERMITLAKRGTLHTRRRAISILQQPAVVRKLFAEIGPLFAERKGGYTRIMRLGRRRGDAAEMCIIELVTEPLAPKAEEPVEETAADTPPEETAEDAAAQAEAGAEEAEVQEDAPAEPAAEEPPPADTPKKAGA